MKFFLLTLLWLLPHSFALVLQQEDDLVFDDRDEVSSSLTRIDSGSLQRQGRHQDQKKKNVEPYEAHGIISEKLPHWLYWDEPAKTLLEVPSEKDVGQDDVSIRAFGNNVKIHENDSTVAVKQAIQNNRVKSSKQKNKKSDCDDKEYQTLMTILLDATFENLEPEVRVKAIENLARFMDIQKSSLSIHPQRNFQKDSSTVTTIRSGPGNVKHRKEKSSTVIQWRMGCDNHNQKHQQNLIEQLSEQSKDGTLAEVLQLPVLLWRVENDSSAMEAEAFERNRRETGSGDSTNSDDDYDGYDDDDENYDDYDDSKNVVTEASPATSGPLYASTPSGDKKINTESESEHPHRHHHGEETIDLKTTEGMTFHSTKELPITTTTTVNPPSYAPSSTMSTTTDTTTSSQEQNLKTLETSSTTIPTSIITTLKTTTITTSTIPTTTTSAIGNSPPVLRKRLQKLRVFAGKPLSQIIPIDTFHDDVDGNTRNLQLTLQPKFKWIEFNNKTQEIYGIPLVEQISTHSFKLTATNSRGLSVSEVFDIYVQQPSKRVEFEFHFYLDILHRDAFSSYIDWQLKVIQNIAQLFGDRDNSHITLTAIHMENDRRAILSWTNDTLSTFSECPTEKIEQILGVLVDKEGNPSKSLKSIFLPEINVTSIVNRPGDRSQCSNAILKYAKSEFTTEDPAAANYNPMLRNQIDFLNCTVGQLFIFKVPEDTFFDRKDGSTRNLNLSLRNSDGTEISQDEWLQFDRKNQEFYGVPLESDPKLKSYLLEARDKEGLSARDSLKVNVHFPVPVPYSVEFSMTLEVPYEDFAKSAKRKRSFIETLCQLFGDADTGTISLKSITRGSTVVTWRNTTLSTDRCPNEEIEKLRKVLVKEDKTFTDRVDTVMGGKDFPVRQITLTPLAACLGELTSVHTPDSFIPPFDDSRSAVGTSNDNSSKSMEKSKDDYLITFVLPAIIILAMIVLAGTIACIFYKRRRSGKMSISEQDDERQSFRNKGIPVIFQDELDEKPDPGNKSPIILKEEKPPLPPPEYQKTEDGADVPMLPKENSEEPYQPPPPFATNRDNNRQNRPKPTPTYRKPPPYVPP